MINWDKSCLVSLGSNTVTQLHKELDSMTFTDYIKYLGLYNPQNVSKYVEINRLKLLEKK